MRIHQLLPTISYGDAVSNDTFAMSEVISEMGIDNGIYAINIDSKISNRAKGINQLTVKSDDVVIFHMSTGSELSAIIPNLLAKRKIIRYHNITPSLFFKKYSDSAFELSTKGRQQLQELNNCFSLALCDSNYNKKELDKLGYKNTKVLPIIMNYNDYNKEPDEAVIKKYRDGNVNILFLGRITPNKKQEDVIKSFYAYNKYINSGSRLFLIGSISGMDRYVASLKNLISELKLNDKVIMPGHSSFKEILAYYQIADVFLCLSEHEGFCVPLIESMVFKVPIVAFDSCAVPETLGDSGIVVKQKKYDIIAELIDIVITDSELKNKIINAQSKRLEYFDSIKVKSIFKEYLEGIL